MLDKLHNQEYVVFDIETTGLSYADGDEIIEIAGQKVYNGDVIDEFHSLINPKVPVGEEALRVHGLGNDYLARHGKQAVEVLPRFLEFSKNAILVGHNILGFDVAFVNAQLDRLEMPKMNNYVIDTLIMSRKLMPNLPNHRLSTVAAFFNFETAGAHRALFDVEMNRKVFMELLKIYTGGASPQKTKHTLL